MVLAGESFYKFMAYERAASTLENAPPAAELIASGELTKLPGIGKSIAAVISEIVATGTAAQLEELHRRFPPTLFEVLGVSGIGIKTAALFFERYGIASLADLGRVTALGEPMESAVGVRRRG